MLSQVKSNESTVSVKVPESSPAIDTESLRRANDSMVESIAAMQFALNSIETLEQENTAIKSLLKRVAERLGAVQPGTLVKRLQDDLLLAEITRALGA